MDFESKISTNKINRLFLYKNNCEKCTTDLKSQECFRCNHRFCRNHIYNYLSLLKIYPERRSEFILFNFHIFDGTICATCFLKRLKLFTHNTQELILWDLDQGKWVLENRPFIDLHPRMKLYFDSLWEHYKNYQLIP